MHAKAPIIILFCLLTNPVDKTYTEGAIEFNGTHGTIITSRSSAKIPNPIRSVDLPPSIKLRNYQLRKRDAAL